MGNDETQDAFAFVPPVTGKTLRDDGIKKIIEGKTWIEQALDLIPEVKYHIEEPFTVEAIRLQLLDCGIPAPHHCNAWGALGMVLSRKRIIQRNGIWLHATDRKSHARMLPQYVWV